MSEVLLNEFRAGKLGRISLETPRLIQHETEIALAEAEVQALLDAEKAIADGKKKAKTRRNRKH